MMLDAIKVWESTLVRMFDVQLSHFLYSSVLIASMLVLPLQTFLS